MRVEQKLKMLQEEGKGRRKGGVCCPMHGGCCPRVEIWGSKGKKRNLERGWYTTTMEYYVQISGYSSGKWWVLYGWVVWEG